LFHGMRVKLIVNTDSEVIEAVHRRLREKQRGQSCEKARYEQVLHKTKMLYVRPLAKLYHLLARLLLGALNWPAQHLEDWICRRSQKETQSEGISWPIDS